MKKQKQEVRQKVVLGSAMWIQVTREGVRKNSVYVVFDFEDGGL